MGQDHAASPTMVADNGAESGQSPSGGIEIVGPDSLADVDEFTPLPTLPEQFHVHDLDSASWLVRRINEARAHAKRVADWADKEIRQARREEEFFMMRYGREIRDFAVTEISKLKGRRKSISLPGGVIGLRRLAAKLVIDDATATAVWARSNCPDALVVTESLNKTALNEHFKTTGELPGGSHLEPEVEKFYVA